MTKAYLSRIAVGSLALLLLGTDVSAQRSAVLLTSDHREALAAYLQKHAGWEYLPESEFDKAMLKEMRKAFGSTWGPYYCRGDFNRDEQRDFAVIVVHEGGPVRIDRNLSADHGTLFRTRVVVFNGVGKGKYRVAFEKGVDAPLLGFLQLSSERKRRLVWAIAETEENMIFTPTRRTYIVEHQREG